MAEQYTVEGFREEIEAKKGQTVGGSWVLCIADVDRKIESLLAAFDELQEKAGAEMKRLWDMMMKDAKLNSAFLEDVRTGACLCEYPVIRKERCPVHGYLAFAKEMAKAAVKYDHAIQERARLDAVDRKQDGTAWSSGKDLDKLYADWVSKAEDFLGIPEEARPARGWEKSGSNLVAGPVESVPGTAEPERVKVPVKFESGLWPVGLDNLLKALRSSFAVNPDDSAYDKNLGEALAEFDGPPSTTELLETLPGVKVISEEECFPLKRCPDCLGRGGHDRQSMGVNEDSWNECRRCKGTGTLPEEENEGSEG